MAKAYKIKCRDTGAVEEKKILGEKLARACAIPGIGQCLRFLIFDLSPATKILGWLADRRISRFFIPGFIRKNNIDVSEIIKPISSFTCFNDFFHRRINRDFIANAGPNHILSPADGSLLAYSNIRWTTPVSVKHSQITAAQLFTSDGKEKPDDFDSIDMFIIRLAPTDYHRFHFPCSCLPVDNREIPGKYLPVHPAAMDVFPRVHTINHRHVGIFQHEHSRFIQVEVGAFAVGCIQQTWHDMGKQNGMSEKGLFKLGGSTVILIFPHGILNIDEDLLEAGAQQIETTVKAGDHLASFQPIRNIKS